MDNVKKIIGENLRKVCKAKGIRNYQIADYMGVSESSISHWFRGDNFLDMDNLVKLCEYLNVSLDQISGLSPFVVNVLSEDESALLSAYRSSSDEVKNIIRRALNMPTFEEKDTSLKAE